MTTVSEQLALFVDHYRKSCPEITAPYDPEWRSPCEIGDAYNVDGQTLIRWQPLLRGEQHAANGDLVPVARALDVEIHPDIRDYYGTFWSGNLEAEAPEGHVSLIQLWNTEDIDRLNENLIGHAFAQKHSRSPLSLFFACTEPESEYFLTLRNDTGEVQLERPGYKPERTVAGSLTEFLECLVPTPPAE
ncbi:MAG: SecY-interacting protein Syd [Pseudomonadales bacterium]|nr:SecY-interacting protein Syd [Pseudomonadales bacterium]MDP6471831.1 SecY-interacting protein Syd [Pseudomonadales bacterium]MDP6828755.1 SecY-interacting protein Syd [Pseudomonadales bacterium]MDP6970312.1 SecY-interacting protein Syd [Pseudomonadales bacterium]